jgi:hypothetical protein
VWATTSGRRTSPRGGGETALLRPRLEASKFGTTRAAGKFRRLPIITTSVKNLSVLRRFSMGWGAMFLPPEVTMMSFLRSVMTRQPSGSTKPMSPVWSQPSPSITSAVASGLR